MKNKKITPSNLKNKKQPGLSALSRSKTQKTSSKSSKSKNVFGK